MTAAPEMRSDATPAADSEALWRAMSAELRAFVARRVRDPHDADDIVQDVFVRIHRGLPGVRDEDRLLGWVHQIARNAITDHYRSAPRRREVATELLPDLADEQYDGDEGESVEVRRELARCLDPILASLPPHHREALQLTELGGLTQADAARQVGVSPSGMKSRVQRGRRQLLDALHDCCTFSIDGRGAPIAYRPRCDDCDPCG